MEQTNILKERLPFWDYLTPLQRKMIESNSTIKKISQGQSIYQVDSDCLGLIVVLSGCIRTYITSEDGKEVTLYRLHKDDMCILSASCILENIDFDVFIDTQTDCTLLQISSIIISKIIEENVHVELFSYKLATERFSDVMWAMQQILFLSFDKRLASFLLDEAHRTNNLVIRITHEQIAKHLGTAREVVSRMLNYFSKEGYVSISRGKIHIIDKEALYHIK